MPDEVVVDAVTGFSVDKTMSVLTTIEDVATFEEQWVREIGSMSAPCLEIVIC